MPIEFSSTRNGNPLPDERTSTLELLTIPAEQAGAYRITATGRGGGERSGSATVTVASLLAIRVVTLDSGTFEASFNGITGRTYLLEFKPALGPPEWTQTADVVAGESSSFSVPGAEPDAEVFGVRTR